MFFHASEEFVHPGINFFRTVDGESDFRYVTHSHSRADLAAYKATGGHQPLERRSFFFLRADNGNEDAAALSAGCENDFRDVAWGDARVGKLAFKHRCDLFG